MSPIEIARFWSKVIITTAADCWIWQGRQGHKKYGRYMRTSAHRTAYTLLVGPVPDGLILRHTCDTPLCCNPRHLIPGTFAENSQDCIQRGRIAHGEKHGHSKLTTEQALYIRRNPDKLKGVELASRYGISQSTVSYIRSGSQKTWKYLPTP